MRRSGRFLVAWLLATTLGGAAPPLVLLSVPWLAQQPLGRLPGPVAGFAALISSLAGGIFLFALAQWLVVRRGNLLLWYVATALGLVVSFPAAFLGAFLATGGHNAPGVIRPLPWLSRPVALLVLSTLGGLPGGIAPGLILRLALRRGRTILWVPVSMLAWGLGMGVLNLALQLTDASRPPLTMLTIVKLWSTGALGGLAYGVVLGIYLRTLYRDDPGPADVPGGTIEDEAR